MWSLLPGYINRFIDLVMGQVSAFLWAWTRGSKHLGQVFCFRNSCLNFPLWLIPLQGTWSVGFSQHPCWYLESKWGSKFLSNKMQWALFLFVNRSSFLSSRSSQILGGSNGPSENAEEYGSREVCSSVPPDNSYLLLSWPPRLSAPSPLL